MIERAARKLDTAMSWRMRRLREILEHPRWGMSRTVKPTGDRALVTGWFSWSDPCVTAGDLLARDVACRWLAEAGRSFDVANAAEFGHGVNWRKVDSGQYSDVIFVCGPVESERRLNYMVSTFAQSRWIGLNVTMLRPLDIWNPFAVLIERDSARLSRPDLAFVADSQLQPVIGAILVEPYGPEYPERDRQDAARAAVDRLLMSRPLARVDIDTRLKANEGRLRSADGVESLIARMDAVVTTRLHGLVLALKHSVPALAIDPIAGGAKIAQQAGAVGWPVVRTADNLDVADLDAALDYCLSEDARSLAAACAANAAAAISDVRGEFLAAVSDNAGLG